MKTTLVPLILAFSAVSSSAFFVPMTLQEKADRADLIGEGSVVSITRLMPKPPLNGSEDSEGAYMGAGSIAVVRIARVWKIPERTKFLLYHDLDKRVMPQFIMVPCDYSFHESPSDLTTGRAYVMFLRDMGSNIYHPIDPASTHVVRENRVARFGMNHSPDDKTFIAESTPIEDFRAAVAALTRAKPRGEPGGAANGSQPVRPATNSTPSAAGSRR